MPESAVIDTGNRKVVYVESEPGVFEGREVVARPPHRRPLPGARGPCAGEKVAAARRVPDRRREPHQPDGRRYRAPPSEIADVRRIDTVPSCKSRSTAMIESIIEWSIRNRFLVILASLVLGDRGRPRHADACRSTRSPTCPRTR